MTVKAGTVERRLPVKAVVTDPKALRWGVVSTVKAPLEQIQAFAAWHLEAGAAALVIYLDTPDPDTAAKLNAHQKITAIQCDDTYWQEKPDKARKTHQLRQAFNASRTYRKARDLHWLAHLDVDEFLLSDGNFAQELAEAPADCAFLRLSPAEMLSTAAPTTRYFKRTPGAAGQSDDVLATLFPTFGAHLPHGFISYAGGKNIVRTGLGKLRLGIHQTLVAGARITNGVTGRALIGHAHAPDFETFQIHLKFRMSRGSYRNLPNGNKALHGLLQLLETEEGPQGLRRFYAEVCTARPELLDGLRAHGMLEQRDMNLEALVAKHFGKMTGAAS